MTSPKLPPDQAAAAPAPLEAVRLWWRLVPSLAPIVLVAYLLNGLAAALMLARGGRPEAAHALATAATALLLGASWLGQVWAGALALLSLGGAPASAPAAWRAVRGAGERVWLFGLLRAVLLYAPCGLAAAVVSAGGPPELGKPSFGPLAVLLLVPLSVVLGALWSLAPVVAVAERPGGPLALLARARSLGDRVFGSALGWGGALVVLSMLTSLLPVGGGLWMPNHAVGSLLWVLLAVLYVRGRENADSGWRRESLAALAAGPAPPAPKS